MKLLRFGNAGEERAGLLDAQGQVRSLSPIVRDIDATVLSPDGLRFLAALDPAKLPLVAAPGRIGSPVSQFRQIFGIGLNYKDHAIEAKLPIPEEPVVFHKSTSSICGPNDDIVLPADSKKTDWEVELGVVIGSTAAHVGVADAGRHIAGYCLVNDVSERYWQMERGGQWGKGKSFDSFTPVGPWLVTADEVGDPQALALSLDVNGQRMQNGNTAEMIFSVHTIVSYLSQFLTLQPGDLIITGTPAGVGLGMTPPRFLQKGDTVAMAATALGTQQHRVTAR
jgi:ureidoglycolate lyase